MSGSIGTIKAPSALYTEEPDNSAGQITAQVMRNLAESSFGLVLSPNGVKTASYTAVISDRGTIVPFNVAAGSANFTIPANIFAVGNTVGMLWLAGAAIQPAFVAGAGTTIANSASLTLRGAGSIGYAWQYSSNVWYVLGDIT
jgi:hypothetical protein